MKDTYIVRYRLGRTIYLWNTTATSHEEAREKFLISYDEGEIGRPPGAKGSCAVLDVRNPATGEVRYV